MWSSATGRHCEAESGQLQGTVSVCREKLLQACQALSKSYPVNGEFYLLRYILFLKDLGFMPE